MKLQVTQENLNKALNNVARVATTRNPLPILSNVLIKTVNNRLCVAATDLNIAITHYIGSKVSNKGAITVPARLMQDFISSLPSGVINLELEDTKLHITAGKYKSVINGVPADDYPVMPSITEGKTWKISSKLLKQALNKTVIAASNDEARPVLTGVYFHTNQNKLYIVATDSYRLAEARVIPLDQSITALIPASSAQDLLRILSEEEQEVTVVCDDQQILFKTGDVEMVARLIDEKYPDYKKLIPTKFKTSAVVKKTDLQNTTKVASLFARESAGSVNLSVNVEKKNINIDSIASQVGENSSDMDAKTDGESSKITLNSRFITDALSVMKSEQIKINFNNKLEPIVLNEYDDDTYTHIIMPLKG